MVKGLTTIAVISSGERFDDYSHDQVKGLTTIAVISGERFDDYSRDQIR